MAKRNDGNEDDLRVRPRRDAHPLTKDNPFTGERPVGEGPCAEYGEQVDLPGGTPPEPPNPDTPVGPWPQYDWTDIEGICEAGGLNTRSVNRIIMQILKLHFSDPAKITQQSLKQYVYTDNPVTSKIRIVMNTTFNLAQNGLLPAIVVKRGQQREQRLVIGDVANVDDRAQGRIGYVRAWQGAHRLMLLGNADAQIEDLALEVAQLFTCLSPVLRYKVPFSDFQVTDISEVGIVEDLGQTLGVAIELIYSYEYGWTVLENAPELRGVAFEADVTLDVQDT